MKKLLLLCVLLLAGAALAQNSPVVGNLPDNGPVLPTVCVIGQVYSQTAAGGGGIGLYFCNPANTWIGPFTSAASPCTTCVTSAASLTSTAIMTGAGGQASQTPSATSTLDSSGNLSVAGSVSLPNGATATPSLKMNSAGWYSPGTNVWNFQSAASNDKVAFQAGGVGMVNTVPIGWRNSATTPNGALVAAFSLDANGIIDVGSGSNGDKTGLLHTGNILHTASDFTTAANTNLQTITGLSWTFPAVAQTFSFHCSFNFSQATATAAVAFGVQMATNAGTFNGNGTIYTSTTAETTGTLAALASTTATAVVSATPSAITTIWKAEMDGTVEGPASAMTFNIMVSTATSGDAVTVKRGSYCMLF